MHVSTYQLAATRGFPASLFLFLENQQRLLLPRGDDEGVLHGLESVALKTHIPTPSSRGFAVAPQPYNPRMPASCPTAGAPPDTAALAPDRDGQAGGEDGEGKAREEERQRLSDHGLLGFS